MPSTEPFTVNPQPLTPVRSKPINHPFNLPSPILSISILEIIIRHLSDSLLPASIIRIKLYKLNTSTGWAEQVG
ncbi:hypothetical protein BYT27DRAFT_7296345 [Phlegmacium glaucopus]|nr:hypothetical protein BYT27DRAFT_7296345 [Phlegmacium glaucopus]